MTNNLNQYPYPEDEINLVEIIKILIESKKLIVSTILIFTIASIIYTLSLKPSFITSAKLEIGNLELSNGDTELIESSSNLISNLKVSLLKKSENEINHDLSINSIEGKVISLEIISSSAEHNENLLTEIISFIDERHSRLQKLRAEQNKNKISFDIESTKAEINHFTAKLSSKNQSQYLDIISNLEKEDQAIENLKLLSQNSSYTDQIFALNQKLTILIQNLKNSDFEAKIKTHLIGNIETENIKPKTQLTVLLAIFIGLTTGILLVFIRNFLKSLRESKA
jgi:capsular polysaccharide biosynthesis protein